METNKAMPKVISNFQVSCKLAFEKDPSDLHCFLSKGTLAQYGSKGKQHQQKPYSYSTKAQYKKPGAACYLTQHTSCDLFLLHVDTSLPLEGQLAHCIQNWQKITSDPWILRVVRGYQIEWTRSPFQVCPATSKEAFQLVAAKVENLLQKQAVGVVSPHNDQFVSLSFFGTEEGCIIPPGNQLEATEHFHQEETLQDGRC